MKVKRIKKANDRIKPDDILQMNWDLYNDYLSGMFKFELAKKYFIEKYEVHEIIESVMLRLKLNEPKIVRLSNEFVSWQEAAEFRQRLKMKYDQAPIINNCKIIMSDL